jgi:hypothetical protein
VSLTETRQALATALSTVDGVTGYTRPPSALRPGDAWPRFSGMERDAASGEFMVTWRVLILLAMDEAAALDSIADLIPGLYAALQPLAYVQSFTPVVYRTAATAEQPALELVMIRE